LGELGQDGVVRAEDDAIKTDRDDRKTAFFPDAGVESRKRIVHRGLICG